MFKGIFGVNNIKGNIGSLKKVFGECDPAAIYVLGKFLKTCEEKRGITLFLQDMCTNGRKESTSR